MPRPSRQSVSHAVVPFSALAPKRRGEFSEAAFLAKAVNLGFKIVQPWGNSERYDLILGSGSRFWRVQISVGEQAIVHGISAFQCSIAAI